MFHNFVAVISYVKKLPSLTYPAANIFHDCFVAVIVALFATIFTTLKRIFKAFGSVTFPSHSLYSD